MSLPGFQQLSPDVCVAGQLDTAAMDWAAKAGFKSVINNRPDFEGGADQPTSAAIEAAARRRRPALCAPAGRARRSRRRTRSSASPA